MLASNGDGLPSKRALSSASLVEVENAAMIGSNKAINILFGKSISILSRKLETNETD